MDTRVSQAADGVTPQVFVVRIWFELRERADLPVELRGVIEHVPSGRRQYFQQIGEILTFIKSDFAHQGIEMENKEGQLQRYWQWLRRRR